MRFREFRDIQEAKLPHGVGILCKTGEDTLQRRRTLQRKGLPTSSSRTLHRIPIEDLASSPYFGKVPNLSNTAIRLGFRLFGVRGLGI